MRQLLAIAISVSLAALTGCGSSHKPVQAGDHAAPVIAKVTIHGGLCRPGSECSKTLVIHDDGSVDDKPDKLDLTNLRQLMKSADFKEIKAKKFSGACPTSYDAFESIYTFYGSGDPEVLPSCTYDLKDVPVTNEASRLVNGLSTQP